MPLPFRIVRLQVAAGISAAGILWVFSPSEAMGALVAAVAVVVPNAFFAWHAQRERSAAMFLGIGVLRWFAGIALMVLAFWWWRPPPLGFLGTLVLLQLAYVAGGLRGR